MKMGKAVKGQLNRALSEHLNSTHETFQVLNQTPSSSFGRVSCKEVIQMSEQLHKQATTSHSIFMLFMHLPLGQGTRVSNQLGAGNPQGARLSVLSAMLINAATIETIYLNTTVFACRNVFGYIFSNEKEVVDYVTNMAPFLCLLVITNSLPGTSSG